LEGAFDSMIDDLLDEGRGAMTKPPKVEPKREVYERNNKKFNNEPSLPETAELSNVLYQHNIMHVSAALSHFFNRDRFDNLLTSFSELYNNSARNCLAIMSQIESPSLVLGAEKWREFGYQPINNVEPLEVLYPRTRRENFLGDYHRKTYFDIGKAYDFSQVEKIPDLNKNDDFVKFTTGRQNGKTPNETPDTLGPIFYKLLLNHNLLVNNKQLVDTEYKLSPNNKIELNLNSFPLYTPEGLKNLFTAFGDRMFESGRYSFVSLTHYDRQASCEAAALIVMKYFGIENKVDDALLSKVPFSFSSDNDKVNFLDSSVTIAREIIEKCEKICIEERVKSNSKRK
jgi:hypothetical protein